ncbi:MAG: hypothetical protein QM804_05950 [Propionicimonas sp.]
MTSAQGDHTGRPLTRLEPVGTGGDPACWLANVCPECGAFNEDGPDSPCWNCGRTPADPSPR